MATVETLPVECRTLTDQIGETAGEVWHTLLEHGSLTVTQLAKQVDAPRDRVMQAVGWLAREDKIQIEEQSRRRVVSLIG